MPRVVSPCTRPGNTSGGFKCGREGGLIDGSGACGRGTLQTAVAWTGQREKRYYEKIDRFMVTGQVQ